MSMQPEKPAAQFCRFFAQFCRNAEITGKFYYNTKIKCIVYRILKNIIKPRMQQ